MFFINNEKQKPMRIKHTYSFLSVLEFSPILQDKKMKNMFFSKYMLDLHDGLLTNTPLYTQHTVTHLPT